MEFVTGDPVDTLMSIEEYYYRYPEPERPVTPDTIQSLDTVSIPQCMCAYVQYHYRYHWWVEEPVIIRRGITLFTYGGK